MLRDKNLKTIKDGTHTVFYESGQKKSEGTYKDGKENGLFTNWYESGQTSFKGTYIDGKKDGLFTWWYVNGKKEYEGTYNNILKISYVGI